MARARTLTDAEIIERYLSGISGFDIALAAGCDPNLIYRIIREAGHQVRPRGGVKRTMPTAIPIEQAASLYHSGLSVAAVAERAGVDPATMKDRLRQHGVRIRSLQEVANLKRAQRPKR